MFSIKIKIEKLFYLIINILLIELKMKYCIELNKDGLKCNKTTSYGDIDDQFPKYCSSCSKNKNGKIVNYKHGYCEEIINSNGKLLSEKLCGKNANFNYIDSKIKKGIRCLDHKLEGMLCINGKLCIECNLVQASFVLPNSNKKSATHCGRCIEKLNIEKIDVSHKRCIICNKNSAIFGKDAKEYCGSCVKENKLDADNLHHKRCIECNIKEAIFNIEGEKALYCGSCKKSQMININGLKCENCKIKTPVFNYSKLKNKRFCKNCSLEGMINIKDLLCIKCNSKRPSFNYNTEKRPLYCNDCKLEYMTNIYYDICENEDCDENALYNYEDEDNPIYCKDHANEKMVNIKNYLCIYDKCNKHPTFNYPEKTKKLYCQEHKLEGMIDIKHKKCIICKNRACYNDYGQNIPLYCNFHKNDLMINIEHKLCKTYLCGKRSIEKYEDYCFSCFIYMYPDKPLSRNYKTKESEVVKFILNTFSNFSWITDKKIADGCSSKRPDLLLHLGYQVINIEIDENQHKSYEEICENKRLMLISQDINHVNLILIRFNPDSYMINGIKKESPWKIGKDGLCVIKKKFEKEWSIRLNKLKDLIEYWTNPENKSDRLITIIHLFFDE